MLLSVLQNSSDVLAASTEGTKVNMSADVFDSARGESFRNTGNFLRSMKCL